MDDRLICFIDKDGSSGICTRHYDDIHVEGDCNTCSFKSEFLGREKEEFSYTHWTSELGSEGVKPTFKVPSELQQHIWEHIRDADWYVTMAGIQTEHISDLSLEEHYIENEDEVISGIVEEVLRWYEIDVK